MCVTREGIFTIILYLTTFSREITETEVKVREKGQLFDITASAVLPALQDPEEFSCEVRIPEANYTKRQETVFFPDDLVMDEENTSTAGLVSFDEDQELPEEFSNRTIMASINGTRKYLVNVKEKPDTVTRIESSQNSFRCFNTTRNPVSGSENIKRELNE
ncbi:hypothetical protein QE152_g36990 [Popillia japonica]|uniref:Uncharacterized protein n=1 Tax=Popillia japonica TaxID=7064 RepID=A0AAW1IC15_POPJA